MFGPKYWKISFRQIFNGLFYVAQRGVRNKRQEDEGPKNVSAIPKEEVKICKGIIYYWRGGGNKREEKKLICRIEALRLNKDNNCLGAEKYIITLDHCCY